MVFFDCEPGSKAYKVFDPVERRVHITRDAIFDESMSWDWQEAGHHDDFSIKYTPPGMLATGTQGDSVSAAAPTEPSSPIADTPPAP